MSKTLGMLAALSMMSASYQEFPNLKRSSKDDLSDEEKERFQALKFEQDQLSKGLKKFYYGDDFVFALNKKNADKKASKLGLI